MPHKPATTNGRARARARASKGHATQPNLPPVPDTIWTPELQQKICFAVAAGAPLPLACESAGVSWNTIKDWRKPEMAEREPYRGFNAAVAQARAAHAVGCSMRITLAARKGQWKADLAILERRHPEFWGRRLTREDVKPGERLPAEAEGAAPLTDEELEQIARGY